MGETYQLDRLGLVVDETNEVSPATYSSDAIPARSEGWGLLAFGATLTASALQLWAKAGDDDDWHNATLAYFDVTELTDSGYYEISRPIMARELQFRHTISNAVNRTKIVMTLGRPY
jgi:hypothetical protein